MKKITFLLLLFFQLFIFSALAQNVLIIYDDSPTNVNTLSLKSSLESLGMSVVVSSMPETQWDNTNPSLAGFDAVIHLNGTTYDFEMPLAGQTALVDFVQNQGGLYVGFEWNAFEILQGRMTAMQDLILFTRNSGAESSLTYTAVAAQAGNPLLQGVSSPFTMTLSGYNIGPVQVFAQNQPTVLMTDNSGSDALAIRNFGLGSVLGFNSAGNFNGDSPLSNVNVQKIIANAINPIGGTNPTITCPGDITQNNDAGVCGAAVTYTITATDVEDGALTPTQTAGLPSGSIFPVGTTTNTFEVTDSDDNTASCSFDVTVNDNEAPIAVCALGASIYVGSYRVSDGPVWVSNPPVYSAQEAAALIFGGNPADYVISTDPNITDPNTITHTAWFDSWGNGFATYSENYKLDAGNPGYNDPGGPGTAVSAYVSDHVDFNKTNYVWTAGSAPIILQLDANGQVTLDAADVDGGSTDNCAITDFSVSPNNFTCADIGSNTVTLTVTDANGNASTCTSVVIVEDNIAPIITCPGDITINNDLGICGAVVNFGGIVIPVAASSSLANNYGTSLINTINGVGLASFPSLTTTHGSTAPDNSWVGVGIAGNIDFDLGGSHALNGFSFWNQNGGGPGTAGSSGIQNVEILFSTDGITYTAVPGAPNVFAQVTNSTDVSPEIFNFPLIVASYIRFDVQSNYGDADAGFAEVAFSSSLDATDNCSVTTIQTAGLPSGSVFPVGTTTNTFEATDPSGNTSSCSFDVIVSDTEIPVAVCQSITVQLDANGTVSIVAADVDGGSTDNCAVDTLAIDVDTFDCSNVGDNNVVLTITDVNGNSSTCTAVVTVEDNIAPTAVCQSITVQLDANGTVSIVAADVDGGSTDNCSIDILAIDIDTFDCSNVGDNNVVLTVTDVNGNSSTCTAVVTVEDNIAPTAVCQSITVQLDANGTVSIVASDVDGGSSDNCAVDTLAIDIDTFDCSNVGDNNVVLTVTDVNGNSSTCTAVVTVEDNIAPTIACPADLNVNTSLGDCFATVNFPNAVASDNCGIDTIVQTAGIPSGGMFPVGVNVVEFTATDVNGNSSICNFNITVTDNEAPVAVCQNITIQLDEFGNATITAADVDGGSTDQCGVASTTIDMDTFDCSNVGDNSVTLTVTDVNGNESTCTAIVTVEDVTAPVVSCQNITVELDANGTITITGAEIDNGSTDVCGIASYELDMDTFDCSNVGDNTVILTVTDVNGNSATCTATVTVMDSTAPVLVCQDFTLELGADGTATLNPSDVIASNDDACGILTTAVDITEFDCADIGSPITVQVFSQDNNGNLATCMAQVTVVDLLGPEITCPANQTVDPGQGNLFYIVPDYFATGEATAIDNCTNPVTITSQDPAAGTPIPDGVYTITLTAEDQYGNVSTCSFELTVDTILGVNNVNQSLGSIKMYPNPAKSEVTIGNPQQLELEEANIYDLTGRLVQHISLKEMGAVKNINVQNLSAATYIVIIKGKNSQITMRLLKE